MNISFDWLKEYVELGNLTPDSLADLLTFSGLEVEAVEKVESIRGGLEHVVIAQVLTCEPHPDSDHLHLTTVDVGAAEPLHIVCGAPNVAAGQKVVCAQIGTRIYTSDTEYYEIKKGKLRGAVSEGMLCAADELQLGTDHAGIMVLPADAPVGMPAKEYFGVSDDYVLEVAITANRMDACSHLGVARDVVAVLNTRQGLDLQLRYPELSTARPFTQTTADGLNAPTITVEVEVPELCPHYTGITIKGVTVGPSPEWMQKRLRTVGIRPINNIVDATNYVMMEAGQPLHAFDADCIEGSRVVVKCLPQDTKFITLDGVERQLDQRDLMICDGHSNGMCIAGVFGGQKSGITEKTVNIFLESAYFNPVSIRKTSQRHTLRTDASYRYERETNPYATRQWLARAAHLIIQTAGGVADEAVVDIDNTHLLPLQPINIKYQRIFDLIGQTIPLESIHTTLRSLEYQTLAHDAEGMTLAQNPYKRDVTRECDIIEEIMRIYGYNNIAVDERISSCLSYGRKPNPLKLKNSISDYLADNGFSEIMNNSLTKSEYYTANPDYPETASVHILNPLSKELNVMRQTLLYSGLECIARNINYRIHDQKLFEFGRSYVRTQAADEELPVTKRFAETQHISLFLTGKLTPESWHAPQTDANFYHLKAHLGNILHRMRVNTSRLEIVPTQMQFYAEGLDYVMRDSHKTLCTIGRLKRDVLRAMDIKQEVYYADLNWDLLLKQYPNKELQYQEVPKFPEVRRDLALVLAKGTTFAEVERVALQTEKKLLKHVSLFDVYEGKGIAEGMKSYAVSFILQDRDRTLADKQIEATMAKIQKALESQLGAKVRG